MFAPAENKLFFLTHPECVLLLLLLPLPTTCQAVLVIVTAAMFQWRVALNKGDVVKMDLKTNPANHMEGAGNAVITRATDFTSLITLECPSLLIVTRMAPRRMVATVDDKEPLCLFARMVACLATRIVL